MVKLTPDVGYRVAMVKEVFRYFPIRWNLDDFYCAKIVKNCEKRSLRISPFLLREKDKLIFQKITQFNQEA